MTRLRWLLAVCCAVAMLPTALLAQDRGSITGQVVDQATQRPLQGAQVMVAGTTLGTITNAQGRFLIPNVPTGTREVRISLIGYQAAPQSVTLAAGQTATVNFEASQSAIAIDELIVTATGETQRRREVGNAVSNIRMEDVELAAVTNMSQLLQGRAAGVSIQQAGGSTGTGARVRIRGSNSVSLSNEPLVIIDGVRVNNAPESNTIGVGGQSPSRLNDINPEDIENIEILKGPAASALYGTAAANGVIQITTRRGRTGAPRWNAYVETGTLEDVVDYPSNYGRNGTGGVGFRCTLFRQATGTCTPTGDIMTWNPIKETSPFRTGNRQKYGLNVAGGIEGVNYYVSGDLENEDGIYPNNFLNRYNLRSNIGAAPAENLDLSVQFGYTSSNLGLPQNDNNTWGQISQALLGFPMDNANRGYLTAPPSAIDQVRSDQGIERFVGGGTANFRPLPWLSIVGQGGVDVLNRHDHALTPPNVITSTVTAREGSRSSNRIQVRNWTGNIGATANFELTPLIASQTSIGTQYQRELYWDNRAFGAVLLPGTEALGGASARFSVNEVYQDNRTVGAYLQQQFGFGDRIFLTGAIRGDDNSAFGSDFGFVYYPALSASWVINEESWFPQDQSFLTSFRLRGAVGESGLRPGFRDAMTFFSPTAATIQGQEVPAFFVGGTGNPELRPERTREYEAGFEAGLFNGMFGLEATYYNKLSRDALIERRLPPSTGVAPTRWENLGKVRNSGFEALLNATVLNRPNARWDFTISGSKNNNELVELGEGVEPIIFGLGGATQRHQEGYPLGGYWDRELLGFNDDNGDGIIQPNEVQLSDEAVFLGSPLPSTEYSFSTNATFWDIVRISALLDGRGGYMLNNSTLYFRCASTFVNCREAFDPTAPLFDQARAIAASPSAALNVRGVYFEDASFLKLREVAVTLMAPSDFARRFRTEGLSLTLSGRNLHTWTDYTGFDPELNMSGQSNFNTADFLTQPPVRYFTARVNVNF
jgi:TonB-linked SusC/RagA family outer membrane protein